MTAEEHLIIRQLRERGYAVIIWTPEELRGAKAHRVEQRSIELGFDIIECLSEDEEEDL